MTVLWEGDFLGGPARVVRGADGRTEALVLTWGTGTWVTVLDESLRDRIAGEALCQVLRESLAPFRRPPATPPRREDTPPSGGGTLWEGPIERDGTATVCRVRRLDEHALIVEALLTGSWDATDDETAAAAYEHALLALLPRGT